MGGDWNFVENTKIDKIGGNSRKGNEGASIIHTIKSTYKLIDPFRKLYKNIKAFTWSCEATGIKTRLDRFYISEDITKFLGE